MIDEAIFTPLLTHEALPKSREILENARRHFGFVPNLLASMASSPVALGIYFNASLGFELGTLTPAERQIVLLTASKENNCAYCSISHGALARFYANVPVDALSAIESGGSPQDHRLNALVSITRELVAQRGQISGEVIQQFFDAGYRKEQLLEVLVGIGIKTISNYFDHIATLEIDDEVKRMISLQV